MSTAGVLVLLSAVAVLCGAAVVVAGCLLCWHSFSRLLPVQDLEARVMRLQALSEALEAQVAKLRTSKAGRISNAKRAQLPEMTQDEYDGLTDDEKALFQ